MAAAIDGSGHDPRRSPDRMPVDEFSGVRPPKGEFRPAVRSSVR